MYVEINAWFRDKCWEWEKGLWAPGELWGFWLNTQELNTI